MDAITRSLLLSCTVLGLSACGNSLSTAGNGDPAQPGPGIPGVSGMTRAGVGVVDMTPDVGYCAGQYCDTTDIFGGLSGGEIDPFLTHKGKAKSYGVQSRLTARALVVEGSNGRRIALLKTDNYLAQDQLLRRVGQLLDTGDSGVGYDDILHHVTHNHSAAYSSTLAVGVWVFEDVYDARFFENQARKMAAAIEQAAANLKPARMSATEVRHTIYKGNVVRLAVADDGTPAGYPVEFGDHGLVVMRFDDLSDPAQPKPLAVWVNFGEHPESLDGYALHSADYLGPLERFVDRDLGVPLIYSQGDVGSAENSGNRNQLLDDAGMPCGEFPGDAPAPLSNTCPFGEGVLRDWNHQGFVQTERNVRYLADAIVDTFHAIGEGQARVPYSSDFAVDALNAWVPGPLSHPYPSVSNCNTATTVGGDVGVPAAGLPDCAREGVPGENPINAQAQMVYELLKAEGVPVPDSYDSPSFGVVQENARIRLQAFRLGDVLLASCACEAQVDLILNLESRLDAEPANLYNGFDWACLLPEYRGEAACQRQESRYYDPTEFPTAVPGDNFDPDAIARMRAQVHNDARGWDAPDNVIAANNEPADPAAIWGNFTHEEIQDLGVPGYALAVGVGHAGDYNGYVVSYREYRNRESYRKALTAYGPHTADYMNTRLVRMAAALQGGPALDAEMHDALAQIDEARQSASAAAGGRITAAAYDAWQTGMPNDAGSAEIVEQPIAVERFNAATVRWRGGSTAADNPLVTVERCTQFPSPCVMDADWQTFAGQAGEVLVRVSFPEGVPGALTAYAGQFEWIWSASFEAYIAFPARLGAPPLGQYRFRINGNKHETFADVPYAFVSDAFTVNPYSGLAVTELVNSNGTLSFRVPAITYPRSYASVFPFIADNADPRICDTCSFRPWAQTGRFERAEVQADSRTVAANCAVQADDSQSCTASIGAATSITAIAYDHDQNFGFATP